MNCLLHIINIYSFTPITPFTAKTTAHQTSLIFIDASQVTQLTTAVYSQHFINIYSSVGDLVNLYKFRVVNHNTKVDLHCALSG